MLVHYVLNFSYVKRKCYFSDVRACILYSTKEEALAAFKNRASGPQYPWRLHVHADQDHEWWQALADASLGQLWVA